MIAPGGALAGRPVLLVHGQPGLGADWAAVVDRLGPGVDVLAPDRPGYGAGGAAVGMAANADILAGRLRHHGGPPAVVVGHSYGGGIAVLLAERHPDVVAGLVLVAPVGGDGSVVALDRLLAAPVVGTGASVVALAASAWLGPRMRRLLSSLPVEWARVAARTFPDEGLVAATRHPSSWRAFAVEQKALVAEAPLVAKAAEALDLPVVVVAGTRDAVVPPRASARLAAALRARELVLVAGAGHFLMADAPEVVVAAVDRVASLAAAGPATLRDRAPRGGAGGTAPAS